MKLWQKCLTYLWVHQLKHVAPSTRRTLHLPFCPRFITVFPSYSSCRQAVGHFLNFVLCFPHVSCVFLALTKPNKNFPRQSSARMCICSLYELHNKLQLRIKWHTHCELQTSVRIARSRRPNSEYVELLRALDGCPDVPSFGMLWTVTFITQTHHFHLLPNSHISRHVPQFLSRFNIHGSVRGNNILI
jgi:hypothetical protein